MTVWFALILGAYLLGSVPVSYLAAKLSRGIDLRQYGTAQMGAGNLWRMTSWRLGLPVGLFDLSKGLVMMWVAELAGLDIAQQLAVGAAAIAGHNWPIFLRFNGGRGIGTTMGVILIVPLINGMAAWGVVTFFAIALIGSLIMRSSPLPVIIGVAALPLVSWLFNEPLSVTMGYLAILLIIVIKRLTAPRTGGEVSKGRRLFNRLFFDRDIKGRKTWMYRVPSEAGSMEEPIEQ